jgi:hypothetical protein
MTVTELATCRIHVDPGSPAPMAGYVVACSAFYELGFGAPSPPPPPHTSIPLLIAAVLWLGAASSDTFWDPTYHGLHNLVRSLDGD